jgi:hypothetical protein
MLLIKKSGNSSLSIKLLNIKNKLLITLSVTKTLEVEDSITLLMVYFNLYIFMQIFFTNFLCNYNIYTGTPDFIDIETVNFINF